MNDVTIETLKEDLARDNIPLVERASNLLAGMVLDKEVYYARVRQKALVALISASVFSNESREMLQKFGFTIEIINEAASALSSQSERAADSRRIQKKSWVLFIVGAGGAIVSVATGMTGLPLVVSAVGAGLGFFGEPIFGRRAKRSKEKEGQICNSALNQADQFHRLLTEHQRTALPAHE